MTAAAPRSWQAAFLAAHAAAPARDFLLVATPGAGKTLAACLAVRAAGAKRVVVVCPTTALRPQWADAADLAGLHLDPRWRNADGAWRGDVDGVVVTYQQVASAPDLFAHHLAQPTFVVLDEVHHTGESATWGTALRAAFEGAHRILALSGTPFRSDARAIPFVRYDGERRCEPDFVYGYGAAVADEVCRPLAFRLLDATLRWRVDAQETIAAFADELDPRDDARRLRTAIDPATPLLPNLLRDADALLTKARTVVPDAAGLVLCDDRAHARTTAALLRTISGEKPVVVVSDEPGAHGRIERFARGGADAPRWLVAVNMVSEGIDVPRLVVAAYATVRRTDLFFRQAVGRVVRRRTSDPADLVATIFLPADPTLTALAERVEVELRQQVSDDVGAAFEVEPPPGLARRPDFQALDAVVEPGGMIVAGTHYSPPEVAAARRLLRELGQPEQPPGRIRLEAIVGGAVGDRHVAGQADDADDRLELVGRLGQVAQEVGGADEAIGGDDVARQRQVAAERLVPGGIGQLLGVGGIVGHDPVLAAVMDDGPAAEHLHDGRVAARVIEREVQRHLLAMDLHRRHAHVAQAVERLGHRGELVDDVLRPHQVRERRPAVGGLVGRRAEVEPVGGQAVLVDRLGATGVPAAHGHAAMARRPLHRAGPGVAAATHPPGSTHIMGSSLTSQSMVRETTLATGLSFQKMRVHMASVSSPRRAGLRVGPQSHGNRYKLPRRGEKQSGRTVQVPRWHRRSEPSATDLQSRLPARYAPGAMSCRIEATSSREPSQAVAGSSLGKDLNTEAG